MERPYFNGQMGIERSMMTIVAKSPGNVNSESKQLSPAGVFRNKHGDVTKKMLNIYD